MSAAPTALTEEMAILGCMIQQPEVISEIQTMVTAEAFFDSRTKTLFDLLAEMNRLGEEIDCVTIARKAREKQCDSFITTLYVSECQDASPSAANFPVYVQAINSAFTRRKVIGEAELLLKDASNEGLGVNDVIASAELRISRISLEAKERQTPRIIHGAQAAREANDWLEWRFTNQGVLSGLETPFRRLNEMTDGLQRGELSVIAARPSQGKTAIALNIIERVCFDLKQPTLFFSLEMHHRSIQNRIVCSRQRIDSARYRKGELQQGDFDRLSKFNLQMQATPFYITTSGNWTVEQIASTSAQYIRQQGVKLIVVDYLQKVRPAERHEKRTYEVAEVVIGLKEIAKRHDVHVLALGQLNRESEKEKGRTPRLSDIGDSGQIEREADLVGLIHRLPDEDGQPADQRNVDLIIAKQRDGATGFVPLIFKPQYLRFEERAFDA
jgi:replicative DNA helicase